MTDNLLRPPTIANSKALLSAIAPVLTRSVSEDKRLKRNAPARALDSGKQRFPLPGLLEIE